MSLTIGRSRGNIFVTLGSRVCLRPSNQTEKEGILKIRHDWMLNSTGLIYYCSMSFRDCRNGNWAQCQTQEKDRLDIKEQAEAIEYYTPVPTRATDKHGVISLLIFRSLGSQLSDIWNCTCAVVLSFDGVTNQIMPIDQLESRPFFLNNTVWCIDGGISLLDILTSSWYFVELSPPLVLYAGTLGKGAFDNGHVLSRWGIV